MRRAVLLSAPVMLLCLLAGCAGSDPDLGSRFRAERALWRTTMEVERLNIRPDLVPQDQWHRVIDQYLAIPKKFSPRGSGPSTRELRAVQAHALLGAARIQGALGDSIPMLQLYARIESEYRDLPEVTGEVAFARGRVAESRGDWGGALAAYQDVLQRVEPRGGKAGIQGAALELPLRIARLRVLVARDSTEVFRRAAYSDADRVYMGLAVDTDTLTALGARAYLADLAADQKDWARAESVLRDLEETLRKMEQPSPTRDPAQVRFAIAQIQSQSQAPPATVEATLRSISEDYPKSPAAPRALLGLAGHLAREQRPAEALATIQDLRDTYPDQEEVTAQALLLKGQILEMSQNWTEAQLVFASLPLEHPVSEAALLAPIEVVKHYERVGDQEGAALALQKAETAYRDFLNRYPSGPTSISAQEKLARTLAQQKRYDLAVTEFVRLGEVLGPRVQGANYLVTAARLAVQELGDTARAAEILDRTAILFADRNLGRWASAEAARLRGGNER